MTNVKVAPAQAAQSSRQEPFFLSETKMSTVSCTEAATLPDLAAIALGLAALCIGTVGLISGTGFLMWMLGL